MHQISLCVLSVYAKFHSAYSATVLREIQILGAIFSSQLLMGQYFEKQSEDELFWPKTKQ